MTWDERLFELLDDLESRAEAVFAAERDAELADRSRSEYASVPLVGRLMASIGLAVTLDVRGAGRVGGVLRRVGGDWCLLAGDARDWLVVSGAVETASGLSERAVPEVAWSPLSRLGLGSALRRLADDGTACTLALRSGLRIEGVLGRVGRDFVEVRCSGDPPRVRLMSTRALAAVGSRAD